MFRLARGSDPPVRWLGSGSLRRGSEEESKLVCEFAVLVAQRRSHGLEQLGDRRELVS